MSVPSYLSNYADLYNQNPHAAALQWFSDARYGLFMHYGVYSLLGRGEWVMLREAIPVEEYSRLKDDFTASAFDANFITDLALSAGMRYITITARHHDSFCLFRTEQTDFNSVDSPCGRDLIGELAAACRRKGLGLFLYYSYALDWRHPYFYSRDAGWDSARPAYDTPEPSYRFQKDADFRHYIDFVHAQLRELLTQYGPLAGLWFDPIMGYYYRPDLFPVEETYALVRSLQPQCLIAFKQGANGDEDFASPERLARSLAHRLTDPDKQAVAQRAWDSNKHKHNEVCATLQPRQWGYNASDSGSHYTVEEVLAMLADAAARNSNLLLNTGPLPDGSIDEEDAAVLYEVGLRLRQEGFPEPRLMEE
ncbi:MAG: alpha-L-fucosidase [Anaerolineae bacterium]|nr:alpha-L-fucosidase [Anaerolineae bacterium]